MREIKKGTEPASLTRHRQTPHCDYDNYLDKESLRRTLVVEQRGLCCYCMARISAGNDSMKVEHWQCQERYPAEQISYGNLLGACLGGEGQPLRLQHCDTRKAARDIRWNPAESAHHIETRVRYELDGTIRSDDAAFDVQLHEVLNLNLPLIKNSRKSVYDGILAWVRHEKSRNHGPIPRERLLRERARYITGSSVLQPYSQVAVWLLNQRIQRMQA